MAPFKMKKYGVIRILVALAAYMCLGFFIPSIPLLQSYNIIFKCLTIFFFSILCNWFCWDYSFKKILFNCVAAYALQNTAINISQFMNIVFVNNTQYYHLIDIGFRACVYTAGYFLFAKKSSKKDIKIGALKFVPLTFITVLISNILYVLVRADGLSGNMYVKICLICCNVLALTLQLSVSHSGQLEQDNKMMEQLLYLEQRQHSQSKENIELINIKCHDLKRQISLLRQSVGKKDTEDAFIEIENAVMLYEGTVITGNKNLDMVLSEKKLLCDKYGINLEIIADGGKLAFMTATDIYSLFGNALDNAIDRVKQEEPDKRVIILNIFTQKEMLSIYVGNYCNELPEFINGLPVTSKPDKQHHGFGTRSIKYITERYGGNVVFETNKGMFELSILLPIRT